MGYEIRPAWVCKEYAAYPPYSYSTHTPWREPWFEEIYGKIKDKTVVTEDRAYLLHQFFRHAMHQDGDFAECGVYKGGTAYLAADTLSRHSSRSKRLHLFDTFSGMPALAKQDTGGHNEGDFGDISLEAVKNYLQPFSFIDFHPGLIPETLEQAKDKKFSFVHIDVDLYQTAKDCCEFFYNRMTPGGVMIFDDYGFPGYKFAEKRAVDEFFNGKPESPISLRTGQCLVLKV